MDQLQTNLGHKKSIIQKKIKSGNITSKLNISEITLPRYMAPIASI